MNAWHLAQLNIAKALAPLDDPSMAGFTAALDEINALADAAPGFVWRPVTPPGTVIAEHPFGDPTMIANLSVWADAKSLENYTYRSEHGAVMSRRRQWFARLPDAHFVLWWVPAGHRPTLAEGMERLAMLRASGPNPHAFNFRQLHHAPEQLP